MICGDKNQDSSCLESETWKKSESGLTGVLEMSYILKRLRVTYGCRCVKTHPNCPVQVCKFH